MCECVSENLRLCADKYSRDVVITADYVAIKIHGTAFGHNSSWVEITFWLIGGGMGNYRPPEILSEVTTATNYQSHWRKVNEKVARSTTCALNRRCGRSGLLWIVEVRSKWPEMLIFIAWTEICWGLWDLIMQISCRRECAGIKYSINGKFWNYISVWTKRQYDKRDLFQIVITNKQWTAMTLNFCDKKWPWVV